MAENSLIAIVLISLATAIAAIAPALLTTPPQVLKRAYNSSLQGKPFPTPIQTYVTRWGNDPLARGSYSYYATGNPKNITGWWGLSSASSRTALYANPPKLWC